jgi:small conductance mechanosensitive channel
MLLIAPEIPFVDRITNTPGEAQHLLDEAGQLAVHLAVALIILILTVWLSGFAAKLLRRSIEKFNTEHHRDTTLANFLSSLVRYAILIIGLVAVLQELGVQVTSILAVLGAASLAVGLALQGALSNVAAGVMLLVLRPYRIGDLVEISGKTGKVRSLDLFVTELTSPDGLRLIMPNAKVLGDMIINYSVSGRRRLQLKFRIDYADDVDKAFELMLAGAAAEKRVLKEPKPMAQLASLDDAGVTVTLYAWTRADDFYDVQPVLTKALKDAFDAGGLTFPYPTQVGITRDEQAKIRPPKKKAAGPADSDKAVARARQSRPKDTPPGANTEGV